MLTRSVPAAVESAAAVLTVSNTSKDEIERLIPAAKGKTFAAYNALGMNIQPMPSDEAHEIVHRELGVKGPYVLTVGTRWPRKNMQLALDAVAGLPKSLPHKVVVTGRPGWGEEAMGSRGQAVGYVTDRQLTALYQCADLYLAPSRHEGFGIPLLEAFACECPVLCSTGGALPEVAADAAEIEPTFEAASWTATLERLLQDQDRLAELRAKGLKRVKDFCWKETAEQTLEAYRRAVDAR
jgi:glycosyltransferase involved in cell wall biosynthesis